MLRVGNTWQVKGNFGLGIANTSIAAAIATLRTELHEQRIAPFPGALETLQHLRARVPRIGLITNGASDKQRAKINRYQLETFFDCIIVEGEFGCGKPDVRVFQHALTQLDTDPHDAWMIGDNLLHDIAAAQSLGIYGVWNDFRGKGLPPDAPCQPNRIIHNVRELIMPR